MPTMQETLAYSVFLALIIIFLAMTQLVPLRNIPNPAVAAKSAHKKELCRKRNTAPLA